MTNKNETNTDERQQDLVSESDIKDSPLENVVREPEVVEEEKITEANGNEEITDLTINSESLEEDEFDDEELEVEDQKQGLKNIILGFCLVLILAGIGALVYGFYPFPAKIAGEWEATTVNGYYVIKNDGRENTFIMENLNGVLGMDLVFKSQLVAESPNEYFVKDTKVYLELKHEFLDEDIMKEIIGTGDNFKEVSDDKKIKTVKYTDAGIKATFGDEDLDTWFKYVLREFDWTLQGQALNLRNASFANGGVNFNRVEKE